MGRLAGVSGARASRAVLLLRVLCLATPCLSWWRDEDVATRGDAPYPYPEDRKYNTINARTPGAIVPGKINVHLVPHTHDDTGWQITVDQYFFTEVYYVVDTVIDQLVKDPMRHFIYVETGFFARWWDEQPDGRRNLTRSLVDSGQLEFINGAWCMHDEAAPFYVEMVDQTTRGHQFLKKNFGDSAIPRGTWQIDPFGHSNTEAWLLGAEAGMESLFWGRTDYQDLNHRMSVEGHLHNQWPEWVWQGSQSMAASARVFAGQLTTHNYGAPMNWDDKGGAIQDNPSRHDYNLDEKVDLFIASTLELQSKRAVPSTSYKIIHYVNINAHERGGPVVAFYSTPTQYADAKHNATIAADGKWEVRSDDVFPLANEAHAYWSGYFTSRPGLKRQVRFASNFLNAARQIEVVSGVTAADVAHPTTRPSPPVGNSWTDSMEGAIAVATHHDGMSGTERQDVSNDYSQRISEGHFEVEAGVALALKKLTGITGKMGHCNCNAAGNCLNMSMCSFTTGVDEFTIVAWNPLGRSKSSWLRIPVSGANWNVTALNATAGGTPSESAILSQTSALDARTLALPLLYLNSYGLSEEQIKTAKRDLQNNATHVLSFRGNLPAVGYATFLVRKSSPASSTSVDAAPLNASDRNPFITVENGIYSIVANTATGTIENITNIMSGVTIPLDISWGYYVSSKGGATKLPDGKEEFSLQSSGAYIFRPKYQNTLRPAWTAPKLSVVQGPLVTEIHQEFSAYATHVVRLQRGSPYIEVEWTAGPIPIGEPDHPAERVGKELVLKFSSNIQSNKTFYTDSNGREMVKRVRDARGPSYPPLVVNEPVAGNYYPVNSMMSLDDGHIEMALVTDVSMGGSSLSDGELELMVHRRCQQDDARGVQEPLNETMCGCNDINAQPGKMGAHGREGDGGCWCDGLTVRGRVLLVVDSIEKAHAIRRQHIEALNFPPTLAFAQQADSNLAIPSMSAVAATLPSNVKLQTLTCNYAKWNDGRCILRLAHLYQAGEHRTLSLPVNVSLKSVFATAGGLRITSATETMVTANQNRSSWEAKKKIWRTEDSPNITPQQDPHSRAVVGATDDAMTVTMHAMEVRTFLVSFSSHSMI